MKRRYSVKLYTVTNVFFNDQEKAKKYFLEDGFAKLITQYSTLDEVAEHCAIVFHRTPNHWQEKYNAWGRFVEGFGCFIQRDLGKYTLDDEFIDDGGQVTIVIEEELQADYSEEIKGKIAS